MASILRLTLPQAFQQLLDDTFYHTYVISHTEIVYEREIIKLSIQVVDYLFLDMERNDHQMSYYDPIMKIAK